jgi:hypothetical protein
VSSHTARALDARAPSVMIAAFAVEKPLELTFAP